MAAGDEIRGIVVVDVVADASGVRESVAASMKAPFEVKLKGSFSTTQLRAALGEAAGTTFADSKLTAKVKAEFSVAQMNRELATKAKLLKPVKVPVEFDLDDRSIKQARAKFKKAEQLLSDDVLKIREKGRVERLKQRQRADQSKLAAENRHNRSISSIKAKAISAQTTLSAREAAKRLTLSEKSQAKLLEIETAGAERRARNAQLLSNKQLIETQRHNNRIIEIATRAQSKFAKVGDKPLFLRATKSLDQLSRSLLGFDLVASRVLRTSLFAFTAWSVGVTAAVAAVGTVAIASFANLEDSVVRASGVAASSKIADEVAKTGKAVSDFATLTEDAQKRISRTAKSVALSTVFSPKETTEGIKALLQAGQSLDEALINIRSTAQFAQITNEDLTESAEFLASGLATAGIAAEESSLLLDKFAFVAQTSLGEASDVAEAFANRGAASFRAYGRAVDETLTVISLLAQGGTTGKAGGTQASIVIRDIAKAAGKNAKAFKENNIAVRDADHLNVSFNKTLVDLASAFDRVQRAAGDQGVAQLRKELGFTDRSVGSLLQLVPQINTLGLKGVNEITKGIKGAAGTIQQQSELIQRTIKFQFGNLVDSFVVGFAAFGEAASGEVTDLFNQFAGPGGLIEKATPKVQEFGEAFGKMIGKVADFVQTDEFSTGIKILVESVQITLQGVSDAFTAFSSAFGKVSEGQSAFVAFAETVRAFSAVSARVLPAVAKVLGEIVDLLVDNADAFEAFAKLALGIFVARRAFAIFVSPAAAAVEQVVKMRTALAGIAALETGQGVKSAFIGMANAIGLVDRNALAARKSLLLQADAAKAANAALVGSTIAGSAASASAATGTTLAANASAAAGFKKLAAAQLEVSSASVAATSGLRIFLATATKLSIIGTVIFASLEAAIGVFQGFSSEINRNMGEGSELRLALTNLKPVLDGLKIAVNAFGDAFRDAGRELGVQFAHTVTDATVALSGLYDIVSKDWTSSNFSKFAKGAGKTFLKATAWATGNVQLASSIDQIGNSANGAFVDVTALGSAIDRITGQIASAGLQAGATSAFNSITGTFKQFRKEGTTAHADAVANLKAINDEIAAVGRASGTGAGGAGSAVKEFRDLTAEAEESVFKLTKRQKELRSVALTSKIEKLGEGYKLTRFEAALLEDSLPDLDAALKTQQNAVAALDQQLSDLRSTQLLGTKAFSDAAFSFDQDIKKLQLAKLDLQIGGATDDSAAVKALDAQIAALQQSAERSSLSESLQLDPLRRKLEETFQPVKELGFDQIVAQFQQVNSEQAKQTAELQRQQGLRDLLSGTLENANRQFTAIDASARKATEATDALNLSALSAGRSMSVLNREREKAIKAVDATSFSAQAARVENQAAIDNAPKIAAAARKTASDFLNAANNFFHNITVPKFRANKKQLEDDFKPDIYGNGVATMKGFQDGMDAYFTETTSPYLNKEIPKRIAELKGPVSYDATILVPAGEAVMRGFDRGLRSGFGTVESFLRDVGPSMEEFVPDSLFAEKTKMFMVEVARGNSPDPYEFYKDLIPDDLAAFSGVTDPTLGFLHQSLSRADTDEMAAHLAALYGLNVSTFRTEAQNAAAGGAINSLHTRGLAGDFTGSEAGRDRLARDARSKTTNIFDEILWKVADHFDHVHLGWLAGKGFDLNSGKKGSSVVDIPGASDIVDEAITKAARKHGIELAVLAGLFKRESGLNPNAISADGGYGLGQLTSAGLLGQVGFNRLDPIRNADVGAKFLKDLLRQSNFSVRDAVSRYNAGPNSGPWPFYPSSTVYGHTPAVLRYIDEFRKLLGSRNFGGFRADGGPTVPGKAYIVGERGPELHMPRAAGTVIDAETTARLMGAGKAGGTDNRQYHYHVKSNATDPRAVADILEIKHRRQLASVVL